MATYGVTESGFRAKTLQEIRAELQAEFQVAFGADIDVSDESVAGLYIGNQAAKQIQVWEQLEAMWNSGDVDTATGIYLDRLCSYSGVIRYSPQKTRVVAALFGDLNTVIAKGKQIRKTITHEYASLLNDVTIEWDNLLAIEFNINTITPSFNYDLYLDGTLIRYFSGIGETELSIQQGILNQIDALFAGKYTWTNGAVATLYKTDGNTPFILSNVGSKITIGKQAARGIFLADIAGAFYAPAGAMIEIVTPVSGWDSVINYAMGVTGRDSESDAELRQRLQQAQITGASNEVAIANAVSQVLDVSFARVYSNRTNGVVEGRPAKSYEVLVQGGIPYDIALAIFNTGPAGIETYGSTSQLINDSMGTAWTIKFSRPTSRYIWIQATVTRYSEEIFPVDGGDQIKNAWYVFAAKNQIIGTDVLWQRYLGPAYSIPGISSIELAMAVTSDLTPPVVYNAANIPITPMEIALIDISRMEITII